MKVSLVTTVLNERDNIEEFMRSVISQKKKPDEFIIVDGGSTDGTYEILKRYSKKYKWIKVIQVKGASIGRGRNIAIESSKNEIIACTDAGCILDKNWLDEITKPFKIKNVDVVVGIYRPYCRNDFEYFQGLLVVKDPEKIFGVPSRMSIRSIAFKKECWKKVGKLPESYGGDDTLFNIKLKDLGCRFYFARRAVVYWRMRKNLCSFAKQFYRYAKGDAHHGNILRIKRILCSFILVNIFILLLCILVIFKKLYALYTIISMSFIFILLYGVYFFIKTRKIFAIIWVPMLFLVKNISYFLGLWRGLIGMISKNKRKIRCVL
uniref:Glycosyltransferase n=1 Tax=Thermodesulfobacterium geofontis TaxID=1295609 RepID=A0A7C4JQZ3_9BACT